MYNIGAFRCADKLFNSARSFEKFDSSSVSSKKMMMIAERTTTMMMMTMMMLMTTEDNGGDGDGAGDDNTYDDVDDDNDDEVSSTSGNEQSDNGTKKAKKQSKKKIPSFSNGLLLLCNPDYSLVDAYPTLCRVSAIAVAIPVSFSTAERSFSALKRVKTRIRSSMVQERLESLLSMSIERKILLKCDKELTSNQLVRIAFS